MFFEDINSLISFKISVKLSCEIIIVFCSQFISLGTITQIFSLLGWIFEISLILSWIYSDSIFFGIKCEISAFQKSKVRHK